MATITSPHRDSRLTTLTNYLIVSAMMACVSIGVVQIGQHLAPAWNTAYIPFFCFWVALESAYMTRYLQHAHPPLPWYAMRAVEVVILFLIARSLLGLVRGPQPETNVNRFYGYVDNELFALVIISAVVWLLSWQFTRDLLTLETIDPLLEREAFKDAGDTQTISRQNLITLMLMVGVALIFCVALIRIDLRSSGQTDLASSVTFTHVVIYFFLGLTLLSKTRLSILRAGWTWEQIPIGHGVGARWVSYTVLLLIAIVLIAVVLPTQYSLGLLGTLSYLFNLIGAVILAIFLFVVGLILAILSLIFPQIKREPGQLQLPVPIAPPTPGSVPPPSISEFVQSLIFWIIFFAVIGYILYQYLQRYPGLVARLQRLPGMSLLVRLLRRLRTWLGGLSQQFEDLREARRKARAGAPTRSAVATRRWTNPRRLSPRQQVQFYYLAMLRRGSERGYARHPTQTPYEYARRLQSDLPEIDQDIHAMTDEFVDARYSRHDITPGHVSRVRRYWEHIQRILKRRPSSS